MESFLGSFWFGIMLAALGYIAGNLFPVSTVTTWFTKKKD